MKNIYITILAFAIAGCGISHQSESQKNTNQLNDTAENKIFKLRKSIKSVEPFFKPMNEPQPDEWLASFKENGQTFDEYLNFQPTLPTEKRKTIYIQPLGKFTEKQSRVVELATEFIGEFFGLPVKLLETKQFEKALAPANFRVYPQWKSRQILTGYITDKLLQPNLPSDAAALIAFTPEDLYPDETMNFVFGQASLENRVGVWSLYRLEENGDFELFLTRTLKIAVHETGHMFSMLHCTKYECAMSGSNHLAETDKHPLDACPECMAKISWLADYEPQRRYEILAEFCRKQNLSREAENFRAKSKAVPEN